MLHARIEELETGRRPARIRRVQDDEDDQVEQADSDDEGAKPDVVMDLGPPSKNTLPSNPNEPDVKPGITRREQDAAFRRASVAASAMQDSRRSLSVSASETSSEVSSHMQGILADPARNIAMQGAESSSPLFSGSTSSYNTSPMTSGTSMTTPSSALSALTSPFMSLSASSPIFMSGKGGGGEGTNGSSLAKFSLPPAAMPFGSNNRGGDDDPEHASIGAGAGHGSTSALRGESRGSGDASASEGLEPTVKTHGDPEDAAGPTATAPDDASAAQLLLAFSTSPENALRPVGGNAPASRGRKTASRARNRRSTTSSGADVGFGSTKNFAILPPPATSRMSSSGDHVAAWNTQHH